jgi:DNA-directed RNA polymerase specialized sigma24 family protein
MVCFLLFMEPSPEGSNDAGATGGTFTPTRWSLVRRARACGEALGSWIGLYWYPLYAWARHRGWKAEDAADEVQDFLQKICRFRLLEQADPARGRLRSWLLKSFSNHLASSHKRGRRFKRGGGAIHVLIDWHNAETAYLADHSHATDSDTVYARAWAMTAMEEALEQLSTHYEKNHRGELFHALLPSLEAPFSEAQYIGVCAQLDMTPAAMRQAAVRFRQRYRRCLLDVAAKRLGTTCEARLHQELRDLLAG